MAVSDKMTPEEKIEGWFQFSASKLGYEKTKSEWLRDRNRCCTDLFHLSKHYLKLDLVDSFVCPQHPKIMGPEPIKCSECGYMLAPCPGIPPGVSVHREICNSFVHKNPNETLFNQDTKKTRAIFCPRSSFKSSIDMADVVQWVICFPNIRVLIFSASPNLGCDFVGAVKDWFTVLSPEEDVYECNPEFAEFQQLFPEHLVSTKNREAEDRFTSPARDKHSKEPTVFTLPLEGNTAGYHADVGKFDDCVSDANSGPKSTVEQRAKVGENIRLKRKLIMLNGFVDYVGTPYATDDAYAYLLERRKPEVVLIRPAWELKLGSKGKPKSQLSEHDYYLLFPMDGKGDPQLTYEALKKEEGDDSFLFSCQYLCNPAADEEVIFTEELVYSHVIQTEGLPQPGTYRTFSAWDLASTASKDSDYSVGVVGFAVIAGPLVGRMFVREIVRGKFHRSELPHQIAAQAARWKVERIGIEKSPGADFLENDIMRSLVECGYPECPTPEWFSVDTQKNAKEVRIEDLGILLKNDRLYFSSEISIMEQVVKEFLRFKPHSRRKDDTVDCIAHLVRYLPRYIELPKTEQERQKLAEEWLHQKQLHEMIYPDQPPPTPTETPFSAPTTWEGAPVFKNTDEQIYGL